MSTTKKKRGKNTEEFELTGRVKKLEQVPYLARLQGGYITGTKVTEHDYSSENIIVEYDKNGNKKVFSVGMPELLQMKNFYDDKGQMIESHTIQGNKLIGKTYNEYDEDGNEIKSTHFNARNNTIDNIVVKKYDENNKVKQILTYDSPDNLAFIGETIYDADGCKHEHKRTKADGTFESWTFVTKDEHGNLIEIKHMNPDGTVQNTVSYSYIYNDDGEIIGTNGKLYNTNIEVNRVDYEFDHHGNWILSIQFENKIPKVIFYRKITYYGETDQVELLDYDETKKIPYKKDKIEEVMAEDPLKVSNKHKEEIKTPQVDTTNAEWMAMDSNYINFPVIRYYTLQNNDVPSTKRYYGCEVDAIKLLEELKEEMNATLLHSYNEYYLNLEENEIYSYVLTFPNKGYILEVSNIQVVADTEYDIPKYFYNEFSQRRKGYVFLGSITLYYPSEFSGKRDTEFESDLEYYLEECNVEEKPEQPTIRIVQMNTKMHYFLDSYPVLNDFSISDLDLHYGKGFEAFHDKLIQRFKSETKGLILLYGEAGTGKTFYIRHLLRHMTENDKVVIYMPPNMVDQLLNPNFITFLSNSISQLARNGNSCVLLVEDAEPLLVSREHYLRSMGISNLLNLTDGLLNDVLNIQIICTFNVKIHELDKALLRPGRLIAHKEFKALSALNANRLAQQLGIKHRFTVPVNISDVYALLEGKEILTHNTLDGDDI